MIEDLIAKWNKEVPTCMDEKGQIYPVMYRNNPSMFCPYLDYCAYQKEQQKERICTYQSSLSLFEELLK